MADVLIVGGGVGGLTLALCLHRNGIPCLVLEAAPEFRALGVGINILPHAAAELARLGLEDELARVAVLADEASFFNRFGQLVHSEPLGRAAGYAHPQFSIHRADLHGTLLRAARERLGADRVLLGRRLAAAEQDAEGVTLRFAPDASGAAAPPPVRGAVAVGCDGIHSALRRQLHPGEGEPKYTGYNMWRGVSPWPPILTGATMARVGWLATGKMVLYPIRNATDAEGRQLLNWVFEIESAAHRSRRDWNLPGDVGDVLPHVAGWRFPWLDVPAMLRASDSVLEYPMVDQDPLPRWTFGRLSLLGDAAHPMVPRGSNGAGQSILDARCLADALARAPDDPAGALAAYEAERLPATTKVVLTNRTNPPDAILRVVHERTGDKPFVRIEDVMTREEMLAITGGYKRVAGYDLESLRAADE
ncbi:MAG: 2-polyprenyl-6-methoxyphenol hydroxylase and related FAD-dependent oxidoreductases [uncultured Acetobacteraceae bacterium]|uniref:2-polyprenyl-6-methoxyphenol hydroxylase and related FAD-dependent oxidoreductases n=1 Tax=uncultured Acetobacteraceae bacterium TaxID=169975 RepID=A0A6J4HFD8_9PROT|nr:MAG: 2-polyprenyl-6-methoxyphenol hydroxylase and related FAD-dependent oxidoreductases [uncultured Acetobacteraceae bacterium]